MLNQWASGFHNMLSGCAFYRFRRFRKVAGACQFEVGDREPSGSARLIGECLVGGYAICNAVARGNDVVDTYYRPAQSLLHCRPVPVPLFSCGNGRVDCPRASRLLSVGCWPSAVVSSATVLLRYFRRPVSVSTVCCLPWHRYTHLVLRFSQCSLVGRYLALLPLCAQLDKPLGSHRSMRRDSPRWYCRCSIPRWRCSVRSSPP